MFNSTPGIELCFTHIGVYVAVHVLHTQWEIPSTASLVWQFPNPSRHEEISCLQIDPFDSPSKFIIAAALVDTEAETGFPFAKCLSVIENCWKE